MCLGSLIFVGFSRKNAAKVLLFFHIHNTLPIFFQYPPLISPQTVALTATAFAYLPPRRLLSFTYLYLVIS